MDSFFIGASSSNILRRFFEVDTLYKRQIPDFVLLDFLHLLLLPGEGAGPLAGRQVTFVPRNTHLLLQLYALEI